ncbi:hypothetical protein GGS24DRAFT_217713 [Hypoxylon argillaceum]|nr:hypothetical protein GGS24DRAFT_217713 [Hypoxylon argillaceum]
MGNPGKWPALRQTISDFNLVRDIDKYATREVDFIEPYIEAISKGTSRASWAGYSVSDPDRELCYYIVSTSLKAYVTEAVFLTEGDEIDAERITLMRYRDMIVDNYLAAGGDLSTLRYIATKGIVNITTRGAFMLCFIKAGTDFTRAGTVEFLPTDAGFDSAIMSNPFTRGIQALLRQYEKEMGGAKIKKFIFISMGLSPTGAMTVNSPVLHLVVEVCRPGDDGYPIGQA